MQPAARIGVMALDAGFDVRVVVRGLYFFFARRLSLVRRAKSATMSVVAFCR